MLPVVALKQHYGNMLSQRSKHNHFHLPTCCIVYIGPICILCILIHTCMYMYVQLKYTCTCIHVIVIHVHTYLYTCIPLIHVHTFIVQWCISTCSPYINGEQANAFKASKVSPADSFVADSHLSTGMTEREAGGRERGEWRKERKRESGGGRVKEWRKEVRK